MAGIIGAQLADAPNGVTNSKINTGSIDERTTDPSVLVASGAHPWTGDQNAALFKLRNLGMPVLPTDAARLADVVALASGLLPHQAVQVVSTVNQALAGLPIIDGYQTQNTSRVLLDAQAAPVENGPWVVAVGPWSRPADFTTGDNAQGAAFYVVRGTLHGGQTWACNTPAPNDVVDTDPLSFILVEEQARWQTDLLDLPCLVTVADGNPISASAVAKDNVPGNAVELDVNGISYQVGNGSKVGVPSYVSGDGGATARNYNDISAGDLLYWNGTVAGFQLAVTDSFSFRYFSSN